MTALIALASLLGAVTCVFGMGLVVVAAADPEGRGSNYVLWGVVVALLGAISFVGCGIWAIARALS